ncbi:MAG: DUF1667 domain-containing protein [Firmicutes bacterium]|nr:DUF1667 domain-containing protein [Bacillota bacterium]
MICIVCPRGCELEVQRDTTGTSGYRVSGHLCPRGEKYGITEMTNPTRVLTTTVQVSGGGLPRLPVRSAGAVPKDKIFEIMDALRQVQVRAPVKCGQVVVANILGTGIDIIASRDLN